MEKEIKTTKMTIEEERVKDSPLEKFFSPGEVKDQSED